MLTPSLYLQQVGDLSVDKRRLGIPAEQPKPQAPAHLFEKEPQPALKTAAQHTKQTQPPTASMAAINIGSDSRNSNGAVNRSGPLPPAPKTAGPETSGKLVKKEKDKDSEKKKKHHFFGSKK